MSAATANVVSTLNGLFKQSYADKIENLVPDGVKLYKLIEFISKDKQNGDYYHQPVSLTLEHGFSYGGSAGAAYALEQANANIMQDAQVRGSEMTLCSAISIGAVSRSLTKNAFEKSTKHLVANMLRSFTRRIEVQMLYGQMGLATVSSVSGQAVTITSKSWAPGIWSGAENMRVDVYTSSAATTLRVADLQISKVDFTNHIITFVSGAAVIQANDVIFYKGAAGQEFAGVEAIIRNTGSLFNINAANYNLWQGNILANGGVARPISFALLTNCVTKGMEKGLIDRKVSVLLNPAQYDILLANLAAQRYFDESYKSDEMQSGSKNIKFFSQNGEIEIISSIYVKRGHAFVLCLEEFLRVGSSDITFNMPGFEDTFFKLGDRFNGYELRAYTDQALFCQAPGLQTLLDDLSDPLGP